MSHLFDMPTGRQRLFIIIHDRGAIAMAKTLRFAFPIILAVLMLGTIFYLVQAPNRALASEDSPSKFWQDRVPAKKPAETQVNILVDTLEDELNDGLCSLQEAITAANENIEVDACPAGDAYTTDTINFTVSGTITLTEQLTVMSEGGPLEVDGGNMITISGGRTTRVWYVEDGSVLTLRHLAIVDGYAIDGAGLYNNGGNVTIDDCTLYGNISAGGAGGGIYNNAGTLVVANSTLFENISSDYSGGGGIFNGYATLIVTDSLLYDNNAYTGGAIQNAGEGIITVTHSTLSGNSANQGGAIYNMGVITVTNSTLSGNYSENYGAAILNWFFIAISNSTVYGNIAGSGGAISNSYIEATPISNTIVANYDSEFNCTGTVVDGGHNISSDDSCGFSPNNGSIPSTNPKLGPLQGNGGPTWTHALRPDSPAIDAGDDSQCPPTDQRGMPRPQDGNGDRVANCDIGSYELINSPSRVTITGPDDGMILHAYYFTATVEPITTTSPLEFIWQASGQPIGTYTGGLTDTVRFIWEVPGTQIITVTASNQAGTVMDTHVITITDEPIFGLVAYSNSPSSIGESTTLSATIHEGTHVSYTWAFGDGLIGSGQVITHTYPSVDLFTASVTATNSVGFAFTSTQVIIQDVPITNLKAANDSPTLLGEPTNLSATIQAGTNVIYTWDFGDGATGSEANTTHTYPSVGIYTAIVTATNFTNWLTDTTLITVSAVPVLPTAVIIIGYETGWVGSPFTFSATTEPISTSLPLNYLWEVSGQEDVIHTSGLTDLVSYTWSSPGTQQLTVTVSNTFGWAKDTAVINIDDVPITGLTANNDSPTQLGEPTTLSATITDGTNVTYTWNFGDGSDGIGKIITHTYFAAGSYTAIVTATNSISWQTDTTQVAITDVPVYGLVAYNDSPTMLGEPTTLSATIQAGTNVIYTWDFGDGANGSRANATHIYLAPGSYTAIVTATNSISWQTDTTQITITDVPIYGLVAYNDSPTLLGESTTLSANIQAGTNATFTWDFGDGEGGGGQVITHTYPYLDIYTATVSASNGAGKSTATTYVTILASTFDQYLPLIVKSPRATQAPAPAASQLGDGMLMGLPDIRLAYERNRR
jgi:PKD repeat protein